MRLILIFIFALLMTGFAGCSNLGQMQSEAEQLQSAASGAQNAAQDAQKALTAVKAQAEAATQPAASQPAVVVSAANTALKVADQVQPVVDKLAAVAAALKTSADSYAASVASAKTAQDAQVAAIQGAANAIANGVHAAAPGTPADTAVSMGALAVGGLVSLYSLFGHKSTTLAAITTPGTTPVVSSTPPSPPTA